MTPLRAPRAAVIAPVTMLAVLAAVSGCATYPSRAAGVRAALVDGDLERALHEADHSRPPASRVLGLMEKGLVLHYAGRWEESNRVFQEAETRLEELYTKSLTREAAAFLTSDNVLVYHGERFERVFVNYYRALNYIQLGLRDEALVECRKVNEKLQAYRDAEGNAEGYPDDAFLQYLTGILYESGGETNDAWISYRRAAEDYMRCAVDYGLEPPPGLALDLLRTSEALGFRDEFDRVREEHPDITAAEWRRERGDGEIVILHENGFIPHKIELTINIPILETDDWDDGATFAPVLASRGPTYYTGETKIRYWLRVAMPDYATKPALIEEGEASVDGETVTLQPAEDLGAIARANLAAQRPRIMARTIARALAKYELHEVVVGDAGKHDKKKDAKITPVGEDKDKGEKERGGKDGHDDGSRWRSVLGVLVNVAGTATESADTRSWLVLPDDIAIARLPVPAGTHDVELRFMDVSGRQIDAVHFRDIEVREGGTTFVTHRTYR